MNDDAIGAVRAAVAADPENAALRLALAELLLAADRRAEAVIEAAQVLVTEPGQARALAIVTGAAGAAAPARHGSDAAGTGPREGSVRETPSPAAGPPDRSQRRGAMRPDPTQDPFPQDHFGRPLRGPDWEPVEGWQSAPPPVDGAARQVNPAQPPAGDTPAEEHAVEETPEEQDTPAQDTPAQQAQAPSDAFDWAAAEDGFEETIPPPFVEGDPERQRHGGPGQGGGVAPLEPGLPRITFADVGGLDDVKARLNDSFIQPMRHAEIAKAFGKSLRGGLLLYGAPGCGKTFMARAVAGELGAGFMSLVMTDVVDAYHGQTEKNLHAVFQEARHNDGPTVLFLDEIDALAMKRSSLTGGSAWLRGSINQLLLEMDSMQGNNDGLYVLAATNHPWDLDEAVLRPGRLDRAVLVSPPDTTAREAILRSQLTSRPVAGIDLPFLAAATEGFSGADLEHLVVTGAEKALSESIAAGSVQPLTMKHLEAALAEVRPSTGEWMQSARNVVRFANDAGRYDDLRAYLAGHDTGGGGRSRKGWWS